MRKIYVLGLALVSVLAFSAVTVASASAEDIPGLCLSGTPPPGVTVYLTLELCEKMEADTPPEGEWWLSLEWLVKNAEITSAVESETVGLINLIHLAGGFLEPETVIHCVGIFDGPVEPGGLGLVTKVLNSAGTEEISLTKELACTSVTGFCEEGTIFVAPENLPWLVTLEPMMPSGQTTELALALFSSSGSGNPAYEILCTALGSHHETLCEGETSADLELMPGSPASLLGIFSASELEKEGLEGLCEEGGSNHNNVALQEGEGEIRTVSREEIDVS